MEPRPRPKWLVPNFRLPDGSGRLLELLRLVFVAPKGSRLSPTDIFQLFKEPERRWKKEDLEWTGEKLIVHPLFRIQIGMLRFGPVYNEELCEFLAGLPIHVEPSAETKAFELPPERLDWAQYEFQRLKLEKAIRDQEEELNALASRLDVIQKSLLRDREALKQHLVHPPA